jgi:hypothetical protein
MHVVSNHAIQRYLERVEGIDLGPVFREMAELGYSRTQLRDYLIEQHGWSLEELRSACLPQRVQECSAALGGTATVRVGKLRYIVENYTLKTIVARK